jgi:hypothetical protein
MTDSYFNSFFFHLGSSVQSFNEIKYALVTEW